jgi:hypothetical protein
MVKVISCIARRIAKLMVARQVATVFIFIGQMAKVINSIGSQTARSGNDSQTDHQCNNSDR